MHPKRLTTGLRFLVLAGMLGASAMFAPARAAEPRISEPRLLRAPIRVEPNERLLGTLPRAEAKWHVPAEVADNFVRELTARRFNPDLAAVLASRLTREGPGRTGIIVPDPALLDRFTPQDRSIWTLLLARDRRNTDSRWPIVVTGALLDELERTSGMAEAVRRIRRWGQQTDYHFQFYDRFALEESFPSEAVRRAFYQRVLGADALLVRLPSPETAAEREAVVAYWHTNGHYRSVRPFLTALDAITGHDKVDVAHLLPVLARRLLNTFPEDLAKAEEPGADSAASAAMFFSSDSTNPVDLARGFTAHIGQSHTRVQDAPRFGDLLVFDDTGGDPWPYTVVYISDGIVFGRRPSAHGPWQLLPLDEIPRLNPRLPARPAVYRAKEFLVPTETGQLTLVGRSPQVFLDGIELRALPAGPWGRLYYYEVLLAPSWNTLEAILAGAAPDPVWRFRDLAVAEIQSGIQSIAMPAATRTELTRLFAGARPDAAGVITVRPAPELVLATPRAFRDRFFPKLVLKPDATNPYVSDISIASTRTPEEWFDANMLPARLREKLLPLVYRRENGLGLADLGVVPGLTDDRQERLALLRAVSRSPGLMVLMAKPPVAEAPALADYWEFNHDRSTPRLLESFAQSPDLRFLDVINLLPNLSRELLNKFPGTTAEGEAVANCIWTALNFGVRSPDLRFLVSPREPDRQNELARQELAANYLPVPAPTELGDLIVYTARSNPTGIVHMAVQVAGDIVYTKNGLAWYAPWCLMLRENVEALYFGRDVERTYYRRRPAN